MSGKVQNFIRLVALEGESLLECAMKNSPELLTPEFQDAKRFVEQIVCDGEALLERHGDPLPQVDPRLFN